MSRRRCRLIVLGLVTLVYGAESAAEADDTKLTATVDRIIGRAAQEQAMPGVIVGVSWHGRRSYFAYSGTDAPLFKDNTIVEIGSITKVFTTALFAEAVQEGRMQPDQPIQSYMRIQLKPCAAQVTPLQLADFTSGMPTLPRDVPRNLRDRGIKNYTSEDFLTWITRWNPGEGSYCNLPEPYRYSNAGIGLLGYLVSDRLGAPWADLVRDRITGRLGMTSTRMEIPEAERSRVARGHTRNGEPAMPWPVFAWYAAGALRSTASDMLSFGEAALGHEKTSEKGGGREVPRELATALKTAMTPIYQPEDETFLVGMAWVTDPGDPDEGTRPVTWKAGGTDGFNSVIVVNPGKDLAIFIAANKVETHIPNLGIKLSRFIHE